MPNTPPWSPTPFPTTGDVPHGRGGAGGRRRLRRPGRLPAQPRPRHHLGGLWRHPTFLTETLAMAGIKSPPFRALTRPAEHVHLTASSSVASPTKELSYRAVNQPRACRLPQLRPSTSVVRPGKNERLRHLQTRRGYCSSHGRARVHATAAAREGCDRARVRRPAPASSPATSRRGASSTIRQPPRGPRDAARGSARANSGHGRTRA
jgi:hypothetical protein